MAGQISHRGFATYTKTTEVIDYKVVANYAFPNKEDEMSGNQFNSKLKEFGITTNGLLAQYLRSKEGLYEGNLNQFLHRSFQVCFPELFD